MNWILIMQIIQIFCANALLHCTGCHKKVTNRMLLEQRCTVQAQTPVAGTPCVWKNIFESFLTLTEQDQALPSHGHRKIRPHSTKFWLGFFSLLVTFFETPCSTRANTYIIWSKYHCLSKNLSKGMEKMKKAPKCQQSTSRKRSEN